MILIDETQLSYGMVMMIGEHYGIENPYGSDQIVAYAQLVVHTLKEEAEELLGKRLVKKIERKMEQR